MKSWPSWVGIGSWIFTVALHGADLPRVLFSNDATNLVNAPAPASDEATIPQRVATSVAEAAGVDVHLLQPGNGWVPWWRSRVYPADEHYRWFETIAGREADEIGQFMRDGGDLVAEFIAACRARGVASYVSLRLNDYHGSESWDILRALAKGEHRDEKFPVGLGAMASQSRMLLDHPEYQLKPDPENYRRLPWAQQLAFAANPPDRITLRTARIWDWAKPAVPAYKLQFVRELCAHYDIDGLELDFMRWSSYFRLDETTVAQRRAIMLAFIKDVRAALDQSARPGQRRSLGVRVPSRISGHDPLGVDLPAWVEAGVDWVNLSCHYISEQQTDLAAIHRLIPRTPLYLELTFASAGLQGTRRATLDGTEELRGYRLMTNEQFITAAHLAYARGGAGVTLFNFAYYRNLGATPHEPPFALLPRLKDRAWMAAQPQHYFLSVSGNPPSAASEFSRNRRLVPGKVSIFNLDMAPPAGGWREDARLRLEAGSAWSGREVEIHFNGQLLAPAADVAEPYPTPYIAPAPESHVRGWSVPRSFLKDGVNQIQVILRAGDSTEVRFLDIAVR